jgi:hypothetical protein
MVELILEVRTSPTAAAAAAVVALLVPFSTD